jgi:hypothetical protein
LVSNESVYYKLAGGKSVYLGMREKPNRENVERMYKHFLQNKERLTREERILKMLLAAAAKSKPD